MNEIPKNNPFKIPENYWEDFHVKLPGNGLVHKDFKAPEGYLESFKVSLPHTNTSKPKVIALFNHYKITAIAAAIALLIAVPILLNTNRASLENTIAISELEAYFTYTSDSYSHYDMALALPESAQEMDVFADNPEVLQSYLQERVSSFDALILYEDEP